jgi:hypothetical protein
MTTAWIRAQLEAKRNHELYLSGLFGPPRGGWRVGLVARMVVPCGEAVEGNGEVVGVRCYRLMATVHIIHT